MKPGQSSAVFVWAAFVVLVVLIAVWLLSGPDPLESEPDVTISGDCDLEDRRFVGSGLVRNTFPYHAEVRASALWALENGTVKQEKTKLAPPDGQERVRFSLPATRAQARSYRSCELRVRVLRTIGRRS